MMMNHLAIVLLTAHITNASQICSSGFDCGNGYECKEGKKDYKAMDIFPDAMLNELPIFERDNIGGEYCDCEEYSTTLGGELGMTGIACDEIFRRCPDDTICFHGAPCQKGVDENYFCNCPKAIYPPDETFVGEHCEYNVTSWCDYSENDEYDVSKTGKWMCANDGVCETSARPSDKCICPSKFGGYHCEYNGDGPLCDLDCFNGGVCKHGVKNYDSLPSALQEYFEKADEYDTHCICPKGFTDLQCETSISSCGDTGKNACVNGGLCEKGVESSNGDEYFYCNCGEALIPAIYDDEIDTKFAGNHCESSSSTFCPTPPGFNQMDFFCTNMGECPINHWEPCSCSADYSGPRCEFLVQHHTDCTLECLNGGTCFHGDKLESSLDDFDIDTETLLSEQTNNMHCKCPENFVGAQCQTEIETCGVYSLYCLNGGMCIEDGIGGYHCDCPLKDDVNIYSGSHCEVIEATICGDSPGSFCMNNGKCKTKRNRTGDLVEDGCTCVDGFHGRQCELSGGVKEKTKALVEDFMWIYFLILVTIVFVICFLFCKARADAHSSGDHMPVSTVTHYLD